MIQEFLKPILDRVNHMIGRAVVTFINDSTQLQELEITLLANESWKNVERFQDYGFTSHPHPEAEAIALFPGGNREHGIVIRVDDRRYRIKALTQGEVAIFDDQGQSIQLKRAGITVVAKDVTVTELTGGGTTCNLTANKVVLNCPDIHLGGEGGAKVARIGDKVHVIGGSSDGMHAIVEGSAKVKCA